MVPPETAVRKSRSELRLWFLALALAWTTVAAISLLWNTSREDAETLAVARSAASIAFDRDMAYRKWIAELGGVYVPASQKIRPNPLLKDVEERDVTTPSGRTLTLVNPACVTHEVHRLMADRGDSTARATSLNPLDPRNEPDAWEKEALLALAQGDPEVSSVELMGDESYMRVIRPLYAEQPCLRCHAVRDEKLGDVRGGISISIPLAPAQAASAEHARAVRIGHVVLWLFGMCGLGMAERVTRQHIHERDVGERALRESEDRFRGVFDHMSSGVAVYQAFDDGADFLFVDFNRAGERIDNIRREDLIGKRLTELFPGVEQFGLLTVLQRAWKTGESTHLPPAHYCDGTREGWRENWVFRLTSGEVVAVYDDISARMKAEKDTANRARELEQHADELQREREIAELMMKEAERARKAAESARERLRNAKEYADNILRSMADMLLVVSPNGEIQSANQAACRALGYTEDQLAGMAIGEIFREQDDRELVQEQADAPSVSIIPNMESNVHANSEVWVVAKNGRRIPVSLTRSAMYDSHGDRIGSIYVATDIASRQLAEDRLRKLSVAVEQSPAMIVITDTNGTIEYVNRTFEEVSGYTADEAVGANPRILKSGAWPREAYQKLWDTILAGHTWIGEFENRKKSGELYWEAASICPIRDSRGCITHFLAVKQDITERKRVERELLEAKAVAETARATLEESVAELEVFNRLAIGRELRMIELKAEVNSLLEVLGRETKYEPAPEGAEEILA